MDFSNGRGIGESQKTRIQAFDIAKLVALTAVVVGHCSFAGVPTSIVDFLYSFDMPLFFIVSGYFFRDQDVTRSMVVKNIRGLIVPYVVTCGFIVLAMMFRAPFFGESPIRVGLSWVVASLYGSGSVVAGMPDNIMAIGAVWYLLALFWGKLLLASFWRVGFPGILSLVSFIVGVATKDYIWLPWSVQPALCGVLFMYIGQMVCKEDLVGLAGSRSELSKINIFLWFVMLMTWLYCGIYFGQLYMVTNTYSHGAIDVIGGVCGALIVIKVSDIISKAIPSVSSRLAKAGSFTLPLLCMHLLELNAIRWDLIVESLTLRGIDPALPVVALQLVCTVVLTCLLRFFPKKIRKVFF